MIAGLKIEGIASRRVMLNGLGSSRLNSTPKVMDCTLRQDARQLSPVPLFAVARSPFPYFFLRVARPSCIQGPNHPLGLPDI